MKLNSKWLVALLLMGMVSLTSCNLSIVQKLKSRQYLNKGVTQFTNQKYDAAAQFFQKSLELDPDFEMARLYLATAYMFQYSPHSADARNIQMANNAIATFKEVVAKSEAAGTPNIDAMLSIVETYYRMRLYPETKEWSDKVLSIDPTNADAYQRIAVMNYQEINEKTGDHGKFVGSLTDEEKEELRAKIEEGLDYVGKAIRYRQDYYDAMEYQNLLWREKAKLETDEAAKIEILLQADKVNWEATQLRLQAQKEAAKKPKTATK